MAAVFVLPIADGAKIGAHTCDHFGALTIELHEIAQEQPAYQPEVIAQRVVLRMSPFSLDLIEPLSVEPYVWTIHRVRTVETAINDVDKARDMAMEIVRQRAGGL